MATKPQSIGTESAHFTNFYEHLPHSDKMCPQTVSTMLAAGILQVSTAFEHALAHINGTTVVNEDVCDLSDGSDAKLVTTQFHRGRIDANVANVSGKTGKLRIQVYERHTDKIYYFVVPQKAYRHLNSSLEICFDLEGNPKRTTKWWAYEVATFHELATK